MLSAIALCIVSLTLQTATAAKSCTAKSCTANDDTDTVVAIERKSMIQRRADVLAGVELKVHPDSAVAKTGRGEWIIYPEGGCGQEDLESLAKDMPTDTRAVFHGHPEKGGLCFFVMEGTREGVLQKLAMHHWSGTPRVEADTALYVDAEPAQESELLEDNVEADVPWGLDKIADKEGNMMGELNGRGVDVYVWDTGIRTSHEEFGGRAVPTLETFGSEPRECTDTDADCAADEHGHGTFCAAIIGGNSVGVAPDVKLHAVKVIDGPNGSVKALHTALDWLLQQNLASSSTVFSLSLNLQHPDPNTPELLFLMYASMNGVTLVMAAGNSRKETGWPRFAGNVGAIFVGATDKSDEVWAESNEGGDIYAPGVDITSAWIGSDIEKRPRSGTSAASSYVAGAAARLLSEAKDQGLTFAPLKVKHTLTAHASKKFVPGKHKKKMIKRLFIGNAEGWMKRAQEAVEPEQRTGTHPLPHWKYSDTNRTMKLVLR